MSEAVPGGFERSPQETEALHQAVEASIASGNKDGKGYRLQAELVGAQPLTVEELHAAGFKHESEDYNPHLKVQRRRDYGPGNTAEMAKLRAQQYAIYEDMARMSGAGSAAVMASFGSEGKTIKELAESEGIFIKQRADLAAEQIQVRHGVERVGTTEKNGNVTYLFLGDGTYAYTTREPKWEGIEAAGYRRPDAIPDYIPDDILGPQ